MFLSKLLEKNARGNASLVTVQLLKKLKVRVTSSAVTDQVENHPDYPSLYSISDSLKSWKVENLAMEVTPDKLEQLPAPFIAHINKGGGNFLLVNYVNGAVNYIDERGKKLNVSKEKFIKNWDGNVLLAEAGKDSGQKNYSAERKKEILDNLRMPAILLASFGLIFLYGLSRTSEPLWGLLLQAVKLAGIVVTGLILLYELDNFNPLVKQICQAGKNLNCQAVLGAKQAKLFNLVGWGEIGFFYFAGGFLYLLLGQGAQLAALSWLNLTALPYIIFSIFYQWKVARQWCPLCLTVLGLLALEGILCYFNYWKDYQTLSFSINELVPLTASFLLPVFFWVATKKVYANAIRGQHHRKETAQFKYNKEVFSALLSKERPIVSSTDGLGIILGNLQANNTIIKVCNPYCGPCAKAHPLIEKILEHNDDVKVQIIFTATNDENDIKAMPVKHLMALYERKDGDVIKRALDDWYNAGKKDYEVFAAKYILNGELQKQGNKLEEMNKWCNENSISFTPTFFVNGHELPNVYKVEDLNYLL